MSARENNLYIWLLVNFKESLIVHISNNDDYPSEGLMISNHGSPSGLIQEGICYKHVLDLDELGINMDTIYSIEYDEFNNGLQLVGDDGVVYSEVLPVDDYIFRAQNYYTKEQVETLVQNEISHQLEKLTAV